MLAVVVVVAALLLPAHNASQGKSSFVVGADGVVAIHIELLEIDLPELCDVEINLADPQRRGSLALLEGEVPSPAHPPSGCHFHPRCAYAKQICRERAPALLPLGPAARSAAASTTLVACHLALAGELPTLEREPSA